MCYHRYLFYVASYSVILKIKTLLCSCNICFPISQQTFCILLGILYNWVKVQSTSMIYHAGYYRCRLFLLVVERCLENEIKT